MATLFKRLESLLFPSQPDPAPYDPLAWFNELEAHSSHALMDEMADHSKNLNGQFKGPEMKQYKRVFDALVNGEQVEVFSSDKDVYSPNEWLTHSPYGVLECIQAALPASRFRTKPKPKTISINGHEVPEPVREPLENGQEYFVAHPAGPSTYESSMWDGCAIDIGLLSRGLIHLTREAAEAHSKTLLSFTQVKE